MYIYKSYKSSDGIDHLSSYKVFGREKLPLNVHNKCETDSRRHIVPSHQTPPSWAATADVEADEHRVRKTFTVRFLHLSQCTLISPRLQ